MTLYTLHLTDLAHVVTTAAGGFTDNGGYHFALNVDTVTVIPGAVSQMIGVTDTEDGWFDDDPAGTQTLTEAAVINGTPYAAGTVIEAEYVLELQSGAGGTYFIAVVSLGDDAYNEEAVAFLGPVPPFGEALTVVQAFDNTSDTILYSDTSPACLAAGARIATPRGPVPAGRLAQGDAVLTADGAPARLQAVIRFVPGAGDAAPLGGLVRLRAGALGAGLPERDLIMSGQHRVWLPALGALVPAAALRRLPRIGPAPSGSAAMLVHLVTVPQVLLRAEGLACESFWPGAVALGALPARLRRPLVAAFGRDPPPAAPFLPMAQARRAIAAQVARGGSGASFMIPA